MKKIIIITGPTGSGKSDLAVEVARRLGTEIVSADSRQLFRGMAIGTAQPSAEQLAAVPHHLIASHDIAEPFSSGRYEQEALGIIEGLFKKHDAVVVAGGSGLYVDALCEGVDELPECDPALRARIAETPMEELLQELKTRDPVFYGQVDRANPRRVARAVEVCLQTGRPYSEQRTGRVAVRDFEVVKYAIDLPREELYGRIDRRVEAMMAAGLVDEARALLPHRGLNALQTVGYRELFDHFDGRLTLEEAVELIKRNSRRYAKRQLTWLRRDPSIVWLRRDEGVGEILRGFS